jgi:hypothetical protein
MYPPFLISAERATKTDFSISDSVKRKDRKVRKGRLAAPEFSLGKKGQNPFFFRVFLS